MPKAIVFFLLIASAGLNGCGGGNSSALPAVSTASQESVGTGSTLARTADGVQTASSVTASTASTVSTVSTAYSSAVLSDQPAGYYQLNDAGATLADSSGHSISGKYGASVGHQTAAITNNGASAALFPGGSSYNPSGYAYTTPTAALQPAKVSVEVWFKLDAPNATNGDLPVVVYGTVAHGVRYGLFIHGLGLGNQCILYEQRNAGQPQLLVQGSTRLYPGSIYHVVATSDGSHVYTYINGVPETTSTYAGSIDYSTPISTGLQIGGANQIPAYASASFPGTIAQAAVYPSTLSQAQVDQHFLSGQLVPMVTEKATSSDAFVDTIGLNAHFDNRESNYATQYARVKSLLVDLGVRHLREAMSFNSPSYLDNMKDLATAGIHASYGTQLNLTKSQIQSFPGMVGASFEQYEAPNEQDDVGNPNWLPGCLAFQKTLYNWVKSDSATAKYPVLGPALTSMSAINAVGNISAYEDMGNIHDYFSFFNPGTGGWGGTYPPYGVYGSIAYNVNLGHVNSGSKAIQATETGYGTLSGDPMMLDYRTDLRYMTRLFFEQYNGGISRSYSYEFLDEGGRDVYNNFGIVQTDLTPKPAYVGLKSLIGALKDPGSSFATTPLTYSLTGFVNNVAHTLLQKRNGTYVMAIWIEKAGWITANNAGGDIVVPAQTVTLTTSKNFASASLMTMDDNGNMTTGPASWNGRSMTVSLSDKVDLIDLTP